MPNFENQEGMEINLKKIITKKRLIIGWIVLTLFLAGVIVYQFGWKNLTKHYYDKGFQEGVLVGRQEINDNILTNLFQFGKLQINLPANETGQFDPNGTKIRSIILVPEIQNNATTTQ